MKILSTILIVGLGSIGARHARIIQSNYPKIKIIALRHKKSQNTEDELVNVSNSVSSISKALEFGPEAAIISNPASKHIEIARKLAAQGIHLLIEKPLSNRSQGVQQLIDLCKENNVLLMTGYNLRFLPSLREFKKQIDAQKPGQLFSIRAEVGQYLPSWRLGKNYRDSVSAQSDLGGGVLLELSHEIDYLLWIFGKINWVKSHVSKQSDLDIDVEDCAQILIGFNKKSSKELTASLNIDFIRHDLTRKCFVIGEQGTLLWDGILGQVKFFEKNSSNWDILFSSRPTNDFSYEEQLKSFFLAIKNDESPTISGEEGLMALKVIEKIKESSYKNKKIFC